MSNWFHDHPSYTIVGYTILIASTTWIVSSFVIDENKIDFYRAKTENAAAQINNEKTIAEQYKAKVSILESEIVKLRKENERYLSWLTQQPISFPALEAKITSLETQLNDTITNKIPILKSDSDAPIDNDVKVIPYEFSATFDKGESFYDPKTKAIVGISNIAQDFTATGVLNIPGSDNAEINNVKPGTSWEFAQDNKTYKLTLEHVNWLNNSLKASVVELPNINNSPNN